MFSKFIPDGLIGISLHSSLRFFATLRLCERCLSSTMLILLGCLSNKSLAAEPFDITKETPVDAKAQDMEAVAPQTQWLMFTAAWCVPCKAAKADFVEWMRRSEWVIDDTPEAHIRLIDGDREPELVKQYDVSAYPTFVLVQDDRELYRSEGYPGRAELIRRYHDAVRQAAPAVGAVSVGTLKGQRDNIGQLIAAVRPLLGKDGTLTMRIDRPDKTPVVLPLGERFSLRAESPVVMKLTVSNDVLTCRFAEPYPRGRLTFGVTAEPSVAAVTLSVTEVVFELPSAPDVRLHVEP